MKKLISLNAKNEKIEITRNIGRSLLENRHTRNTDYQFLIYYFAVHSDLKQYLLYNSSSSRIINNYFQLSPKKEFKMISEIIRQLNMAKIEALKNKYAVSDKFIHDFNEFINSNAWTVFHNPNDRKSGITGQEIHKREKNEISNEHNNSASSTDFEEKVKEWDKIIEKAKTTKKPNFTIYDPKNPATY